MSSRQAPHDVIVVGGRVAGASTALLLARAGARVQLLERGDHGTDTLSTHGLMRAGVLQLSRWGLLDRVVAAGTPPVRSTTFHFAGQEPLRLSISSRAGVDALYAPRRHLLDQILVDAAADAGADVRHGSRVIGLLHDPDGRVTGVRAVDRTGTGTSLRARYVVGADGVRSPVAAAAGAQLLDRGRHASAVRYTYLRGLGLDGYHWAYGNGAAAGLIPTNGDGHCVFVATSPQRMRTLRLGRSSDAVIDQLVGLAAPDLREPVARATRVGHHHGWAGTPGFARQPWGPGWVLVGDAGHYQDPIGTHGITDALRDAELASGALLEALSDDRGEAAALTAYHRVRDLVSRDLFEVTDEIASYSWEVADVRHLLRRLSAAMAAEVELLAALPSSAESGLLAVGAT
ncbi:NAD(P)/FAD-dependent oxidoreductase [Nocardioides sp. GXQ0305]|uniref:NAD(P)/FAD-dependent oxidoreductase n=1 Tax=Nocardioides sp. GXQ0305 TaxID=3423912 RepID=UPI003D7D18D3